MTDGWDELLSIATLALAGAATWGLLKRLAPSYRLVRHGVVVIVLLAIVAVLGRHHADALVATLQQLGFDRPWWLLSLALLLLVHRWSRRSLVLLGRGRRLAALVLRSAVLVLIILALSGLVWISPADRLGVIFVIDASRSMPNDALEGIYALVDGWMAGKPADDLVGVVYFGGRPRLEIPPVEYAELREPEGDVQPEQTDLAAAIRLALASFPQGVSRRVVLISDGNETKGDVLSAARDAGTDQVPVDVVAVTYRYRSEVMVDRVLVAPQAHVGDTLRLRVVLRATQPTSGTLRIYARSAQEQRLIAEERVRLERVDPEAEEIVQVVDVLYEVEKPSFYSFTAEFEPDDPQADRLAANNALSAFTYVRGEARALVVTLVPEEAGLLVDVLEGEKFEVTVVDPYGLPDDARDYYAYDLIVLNNVPQAYAELGPEGQVTRQYALSETQMRAIQRAVHDLGVGLVCVGGPRSFGAGGYNETPLEETLPVDMEIPSLKVLPLGALVCIFHASEMPRGNFWQKVIAREAVRVLRPDDEVGILAWRGVTAWIHPLQPAGDKSVVLARISAMVPGDMPDFNPGLEMALTALKRSRAMQKHIIVISDGDPTPPRREVVAALREARITVTGVAVATHGGIGKDVLRRLAQATGGRFYDVVNPRALPRIFQQEALQVVRSVIFERQPGWQLNVRAITDPIQGLHPEDLPPITGYVLTTPKASELVDVPIVSPLPAGTEPAPVLAHWRYGVGKAVAVTTDAGARWTQAWTAWEGARQFWGQILRWAARELRSDLLKVSVRHEGDRLAVIADVMDEQKNFVNFADVLARIVTPGLETHELRLRQVAPGRYVGELEGVLEQGSYFVGVVAAIPGKGPTQAVAGITVPYSREFARLESNDLLLAAIASLSEGKLVELSEAMAGDYDPFRHDLPPQVSRQPLWPWLLFAAACLFFLDVANRRIAFSLEPLRQWRQRVHEARLKELEAQREKLRRLKQRKEAVVARWKQHAAEEPAPTETAVVEPPKPATPPPPPPTHEEPSSSYTARLLRAKRKVWESRGIQPPKLEDQSDEQRGGTS